MLPASPSAIRRYESRKYAALFSDEVVGCSLAIPSTKQIRVYNFIDITNCTAVELLFELEVSVTLLVLRSHQ